MTSRGFRTDQHTPVASHSDLLKNAMALCPGLHSSGKPIFGFGRLLELDIDFVAMLHHRIPVIRF